MKSTGRHYPGLGEFKVQCIRETPPEVLSLLVDTPDKVFCYMSIILRTIKDNPWLVAWGLVVAFWVAALLV